MSKGCFLNPHIDNSHDRNLENFRRLNLLYYVNQNWIPTEDGGELVLYPKGIKNKEELLEFEHTIMKRAFKMELIVKPKKSNHKTIQKKPSKKFIFDLSLNHFQVTS